MTALGREAFVAVQKIRHEVADARDGQVSVTPWLTVRQAQALLRWIDKHQTARTSCACCGSSRTPNPSYPYDGLWWCSPDCATADCGHGTGANRAVREATS